jgi:PPK2 family polyphosphate:nucleotide phosphotransferase
MAAAASSSARSAFRVPSVRDSADLDLAAIDPAGRPIGPRDKDAAAEDMIELAERLDRLQEALYAEAVGGGSRSVLLVLQGMDTSGKGGVIQHVAGLVDPGGLQIAAFKKPTAEERSHDFLWRIRKQLPAPGRIGVFDRSHYEDVLVVRVDELVAEPVWRERYRTIRDFEAEISAQGTTVIKCMLHISAQEQAQRLLARLDDPAKRWKYNPGDLDARAKWPAYQQAYADALRECDSDLAPWYIVPADRKWYRNWAIASLLTETLAELDPTFPPAPFDVDAERARLAATVIP